MVSCFINQIVKLKKYIKMDYKKFLESKIGSFLGKSRIVRVLIMQLYIKQQNKKKVALVPEHLIQEYGEKEIMKIIKNHKGEGDLIVGSSTIKLLVSKSFQHER